MTRSSTPRRRKGDRLPFEGDERAAQVSHLGHAPVEVGHLAVEYLEHVAAGGSPRSRKPRISPMSDGAHAAGLLLVTAADPLGGIPRSSLLVVVSALVVLSQALIRGRVGCSGW
jgi:hypothetical protein